MELFTAPDEFRAWSRSAHVAGRRVGLVPTMGALHEGHLTLIDVARDLADDVAVSIFVNPLQFNRPDDFHAYPRPIDDDVAQCAARGVTAVYAPPAAVMYPPGFQTHVEPGPLADVLEGAHRPGHFGGVATVVSKLFNAAAADIAVFGQKDFQQLAVIRRMVADLDMGVEIIGVPTVREHDGLAMSSRNRRLSPDERAAAVCVPRSLAALRQALAEGEHSTAVLVALGAAVVGAEPLARLEHLEIVDAESLETVEHVPGDGGAVAVTAVWFGDVRLIDNCLL